MVGNWSYCCAGNFNIPCQCAVSASRAERIGLEGQRYRKALLLEATRCTLPFAFIELLRVRITFRAAQNENGTGYFSKGGGPAVWNAELWGALAHLLILLRRGQRPWARPSGNPV
jgi:hypothetical protein